LVDSSCKVPQFLHVFGNIPKKPLDASSIVISLMYGTQLRFTLHDSKMQDIQVRMQDEDSPLNQTGLCLLSLGMKIIHTRPSWQITNVDLDGGGVRGLSTLLILKALMAAVNDERIKAG
jgi:hypothetical protein